MGGGGSGLGGGGGGQGGCERRIEVFVKIQKKKFFLGGGEARSGQEDFLRSLPYMGMAAILVL